MNAEWRAYLKALYRTTLKTREAAFQTGRCAVAAEITAEEVKGFSEKAEAVRQFGIGLEKISVGIKKKKVRK